MEYILNIYRFDKRTKTGEKKFGSYEYDRKDDEAMEREINELRHLYPSSQYRLEFHPKYRTVKSLMTGKDVQIAWDAPMSCDPSTETYWSM